MRKFVTLVFGTCSAIMGALIHMRDRGGNLQALQIGLNELSWFPALLGGLAMGLGVTGKRRSWLGILTGAFGLGASLWPFMQYRAAVQDAESAMRAGLGQDYEAQIRPEVRKHLSIEVWSLANALGARERLSQAHITRDIVYATPDGIPLKLNVYQPMSAPAIGNSYPAVIVIQGGGWRHDDRGSWFEPHNRYLASQGYIVFDIQHRLSQVVKWPAQLHNVHSAIRWVKSCAGEFQVDLHRIAIMGRSSGAHLALMAAMRSHDSQTRVQSVVSIYGPTDLQFDDLPPDSPAVQLLGGRFQDIPASYADASPIEFTRDDLPPMLIIQSMMDSVVPYHHGEKIAVRLSFTNTPFVLLRIPWARHGFDAVLSGLGGQLVQYHIERFLAWSLYGEQDHA